jgi:bifunctional DNA-binding transcriptional regulator/antitoxin component of YhaV-PrlF toxin-antitoxin module
VASNPNENITQAPNRQQMLGVPVVIQEDGTIKLPTTMLEYAGITKGGTVEVFANRDGVFMRTADIFCDFCGVNGNMQTIGGKNICPSCMNELDKKVKSIK